MRFSAPKKLLIEDFQAEQRSWIGKLLDPLNQFMTQVSQSLTQGLTIADNWKGMKVQVSVVESQVYPMKSNISTLKERPSDVHIGSLAISDGSTPAAAYCVHWKYDEGTIFYTFIGLDTAKKYNIVLVVSV